MSIAIIAIVLVAAVNDSDASRRFPVDPIQGTVYAATGKPIAGATVQLGDTVLDETTGTSTWKEIASTTTSSNGTFTFGKQHATQPGFRELHISAPGFIGESLLMQADTDHPQRFFSDYYGWPMPTVNSVLWPSRPLNGRTIDPEGKPVSGATVTLSGFGSSTTSDSTGRFVISVPDYSSESHQEMSSSLEITHPDFLRTSTEVEYSTIEMVVKLAPGVLLAGTVRDKEFAKGVANMLVTAAPARGQKATVTTDANGYFSPSCARWTSPAFGKTGPCTRPNIQQFRK